MTHEQMLFWKRVQARSADLEGPMRTALLKVFANIRDHVDDATVRKLIKQGAVEEIIQTALSDKFMDRATLPLSKQLRTTIEKGFANTIKDLPRKGKVDGVAAVAFDHLSPDVVKAITTIESKAMLAVAENARELARAIIAEGLENARSPGSIARDLRDMIGLGKTKMKEVQNFRRALEGERSITGYSLRNKSLDALLEKRSLTASEVERYADAYLKRRIAANAETVTRTITLDAYRSGQNLTWKDAQQSGVVPDGYTLWKMWIQIDRPTAREEHTTMAGERVPFDQPYSNGSMIPGDQGEFNCGCVSLVSMGRNA